MARIRVGHFPFRANGRAMTLQDDDGFVRIVARADNHVVLGVHAVGARRLRALGRLLLGAGDGRAPRRRRAHDPAPIRR